MFGQNSGWGQNNQQQQQGQQTGGLFGNTATGFGQQQPAQTGFGATGSFGQPAQQPQAGGLFGNAAQTTNTGFGGGGGFGTNTTSTFGAARPTFGATGTSTFGATPAPATTGGGLFGNAATTNTFGSNTATNNAGGGLFGRTPATTTTGFGAGTTSNLFGSRPATSSPFGSSAPGPSNGVQQYNAGPFQGPPQNGSAAAPYQASWQQDPPATTGGTSTAPPHLFHVISAMDPYKGASFDELRYLDYQQGRKDAGSAPAATGFGQPAATGFGQQPAATTTFGQPAAATSTFGTPKPAGGLFGTTTPSTGFGATSTGFGQTNTTGGGLFGQQNQQQPASTGMFGQQNNAAPASGGLFGQSQPQQPASGGLFGNTNPFGSTTTPQAQQPATSTFTFGAGAGAAKPAFGATGTGGFGSTPAATNTFGQPAANTTTPSFGGFGQPQQQQQGQTGTTGSLFGTGGFGANNTQNTTGSSLFGQNNQQQQNQPAGGSLFGSTAPKPAGSLFGNNNAAGTTGTSTFGGFGQTNNNAAQPAAGGLFGNNNNTAGTGSSLFGQQPAGQQQQAGQQPAAGGLFGGGGGLFGKPATGTTGSLFGTTQPAQPAAQTGTSSLFGGGQTGSLFGSTNNQAQQNQQKPGGLFGNSSLFGQNNSQPAQQNTGSTGGMFGNLGQSQPASNSLFGGQQQQNAQQPLGSSLFGGGGGFGQSSLNQSQQQQQPTLTASIDQNPYGRNELFNYPGQKLDLGSSVKKPALPPLTSSSFRVTPTKSQLNKLRGFASPLTTSQSPSRSASPLNVLSSPGRAAYGQSPASSDRYKGLSESALSPNAFAPRPSIKKLTVHPKSNQVNGDDRLESVLGKSALKSSTGTPTPGREQNGGESPAGLLFNPPQSVRDSPLRKGSALESSLRVSSSEPQPKDGNYWCKPKVEKLVKMQPFELEGLRNFTAGRKGYGEVTFLEPVDLTGLDLSTFLGNVVVFSEMELAVYPDDYKDKPPQGKGLNVPARISLENCFPRDRATKQFIKDTDDVRHVKFLKRVKTIPGTDFVGYTSDGIWTFTVEHFSKYGYTESDEESEADQETPLAPITEDDEGSGASSDDDFLPPSKGLRDEMDQEEDETESGGDDSMNEVEDAGSATNTEESSIDEQADFHQPPTQPSWNLAPGQHLNAESRNNLRQMQNTFFSADSSTHFQPDRINAMNEKRAFQSLKRYAEERAMNSGFEHAEEEDVALGERAAKRTSFGKKTDSPQLLRLPRKYARVALEESDVKGNEGIRPDAGFALGRSFRCSWGPNGELVHFGNICAPKADVQASSTSSVIIEKVELLSAAADVENAKADRLLRLHLERTDIQRFDEVPFASLQTSLRFADVASLFFAGDRSHEALIWRLGVALFDEIDPKLPPGTSDDQYNRIMEIRRKLAVSKWLEDAVAPTVDHDLLSAVGNPQKLFTLLSGHQLEKAVDTALDGKDMRLATLISQIGGSEAFKAEVLVQLEAWRTYKVNALIDTGYRRLYALLAGITDVTPGDASRGSDGCPDVPISGDLDWKRAFGLRLWYGNAFDETISDVLATYTQDLDLAHAPSKPLPAYLEVESPLAKKWTMASEPKDVLYGLIKLYSDATVSLEDVLRTRDCSPSPLDARIQWHLYQLLSVALQKRDFADRENGYSATADAVTSAYAAQLEVNGEWTLAVFVSLHLETEDGRLQAVKALLARHPELTETEEAFLVDKLQVPQTWLYEAKANQLASAGDAYRQYYTLIDAGLPNQAHQVLLDKLAIEASARGDLALLKRLCEALDENQPEGWEYGGRLFLDYLAVVDEVPALLVNHLRSGGQADPVDADRLARLISTAQRVLSLLPALFPKKDDVQQFAALGDLLSDVTQIVSQLNAAGLMNKPQVPSVLVNTDRLHLLQQSGLRAFDQNIRALPSGA